VRIYRTGLLLLSAWISMCDGALSAELQRPSAPASEQTIAGRFLTLEEAVRTALRHHPEVERAQAGALVAKALTKQIKADQYPQLEASLAQGAGSIRVRSSDGAQIHTGQGRGFGLSGALPTHNQNMSTAGLILNQLVTDFGYTAHRLLAREATEASSEKEIFIKKAQVILNVQRAYYTCLMQERLVEITAETLAARKVLRDQVRALYKRELRSKEDYDLVLIQVSDTELAQIKAQNDLAQCFTTLNNAMGMEGIARYALERLPIEIIPPAPAEVLIEEGLKDRPELLGGHDRLRASEELLSAVKALNFGSVSAVGVAAVTQYYQAFDTGVRNNETFPFWGIGGTLRIPLFTGFMITNQIAEASHRKEESEQDLLLIGNEVVLQAIRAYLTQTTAAEQVRLEQERVALAEEAFKLANERYRLGLASILDLTTATAALFQAKSLLAEAQYVYKSSEAVVAYAAGKDYQKYQ
jgi:outer membrane protein